MGLKRVIIYGRVYESLSFIGAYENIETG